MLLSALLTSAVVAAADNVALSPEVQAFSRETTEWVLAGQELPSDYQSRLRMMNPADRLQAIIILRRSGLLETDTWPLDDLLSKAETEEQTAP